MGWKEVERVKDNLQNKMSPGEVVIDPDDVAKLDKQNFTQGGYQFPTEYSLVPKERHDRKKNDTAGKWSNQPYHPNHPYHPIQPHHPNQPNYPNQPYLPNHA